MHTTNTLSANHPQAGAQGAWARAVVRDVIVR